jgi:hypothetical protein
LTGWAYSDKGSRILKERKRENGCKRQNKAAEPRKVHSWFVAQEAYGRKERKRK